ncbi:hypothetical protein QAD02_008692 [Eretmocerus hayati]|uniref:Uncharacterized protein n=1 Tax=Eretmocerus hayati TaxID=131215 RepID=A0ACC2N758_9HYME|nr:hypothetical protein QAD02_008692 [Eretmocerus hayati]
MKCSLSDDDNLTIRAWCLLRVLGKLDLTVTLATVALCQAARLPRSASVEALPHFHAVHHGHGATSYQNVQIQSYGSVPIPTESEHHEIAVAVHHAPEDEYAHHEDYQEILLQDIPAAYPDYQHQQNFILVGNDIHEHPPPHEIPIVEHPEEEQKFVILQEVPQTEDIDHRNGFYESEYPQYHSDHYEHHQTYEYQ